jgi:hypothetical protein
VLTQGRRFFVAGETMRITDEKQTLIMEETTINL